MSSNPRRFRGLIAQSSRRRALLGALCIAIALVAPSSLHSGLAASQYTLAGTPDGTGPIFVADKLEVFLNGAPIYVDATPSAGARAPITFTADLGDTLTFQLSNKINRCAGVGTIYLVDALGRSTVATPGDDEGCANTTNADRGVVFQATFVIPDIAATGSSYKETRLAFGTPPSDFGSAFAGLTRIGNAFYGVTYDGGAGGRGLIYRASADLSQVTKLHEFGSNPGFGTPYAELTPGGRGFFGSTFRSPNSVGGIFEFDTSTNTLVNIFELPVTGYSGLDSALLLFDGYLYGSLSAFPFSSAIFKVRTDGNDFQILYEFDGDSGAHPNALTLLPDGFLYGTATYGGIDCNPRPNFPFLCGTIFRLKPDGSDFSVVYTFTRDGGTGFRDRHPQRGLVFGSDGLLYGSTFVGVFKLSPNPSAPNLQYIYESKGGSQIFAPPIEGVDGRIYVAQYDGGIEGFGSVYSMTKTGSDFKVHHQFTRAAGAWSPYGILYQDSAGTIFGTTEYSAAAPSPGTVFAIRISGNQAPIADATAPTTVTAGPGCQASVTLDGSGSTDPDGGTLTYAWTENGSPLATGVNPTVSLGIGTHVIRLTVTDPQGAGGVDEVTVIVNDAFQVSYAGPGTLQGGSSNAIQVALTNGATPASNATVTVTVNGTPLQATTDAAGIAAVTAGPLPGTSATVKMDYTSACGTVTKTVTVPVNAWPTVSPGATSPVFAGANCTASVPLTANASDLNGDALTYVWSEGGVTFSTAAAPTASLAPGLHTIDVAVSDGKGGSATGSVVIDVRKAMAGLSFVTPLPQFTVGVPVSVSARLTVGGNPIAGATLAFSLTGSTVSGTTDATGTATVSMTPGNNGIQELAVSDAGDTCREAGTFKTNVTVAQATATIIVQKLVVNDDGGQLQAPAFSISVSSPNDTKTIAGNAAGVPVTVNVGAYVVTETLNADYDVSYGTGCNGTTVAGDTKTCVITNDDKPATLTLIKNVTNDNGGSVQPGAWTLRANGQAFVQNTPTEVQPGDFTLTEDGPAGYSASAWSCSVTVTNGTITVPAHRAVSCTITNNDNPGTLNVIVQVTTNSGGPPADPSKVTVTVNGGSPTPSSFAGSAAGTAVALNAGGYTVVTTPLAGYTATPSADCAGTMTLAGSKTCTVVFDDDAPQQRPPVADNQNPATDEDTPLPIQLGANDPDGDPLSFIIVGGPANGQLTGTGAARVYTPNANFTGGDSFTFKVNDGFADSNIATVSITVRPVNDLPSAMPQTLNTAANTPVGTTLTGADVETATLTFAIATQATNGIVQLNGASLTYTPNTNYSGPDSFTFTASDGTATSAPATVTINVSAAPNTPPNADAKFVDTLTGTPVGVTLSGNDLDGDGLTFAVVAPPANGILTGTPPSLTYTPNAGFTGTDTFTYEANDGQADSAPATVTITVRALNAELSVVLSDAPDPITIGQPLTYLVRVFNNGPDVVPNPTLTVTLAPGVIYSQGGPCTAAGTTLTCRPAFFGPGETPVPIVVVPQVTGQIVATAYTADLGNADEAQNTSTTTTFVAKAQPTTTLSSAPAPSTFGETVTLTATVTGYNATGSVTFASDLGPIGSAPLNNGIATLTTAALQGGQRTLVASYGGDANNEPGASAPLSHLVQRAQTTTTVSSSPNPSTVGQLVTFTATVSGALRTGTVTFIVDNVEQPVALGANGMAVLTTAALGAGSHTVIARYDGDTNYLGSQSGPLTQQVGKSATSVSLVIQPNPAAPGTTVALIATVTGFNPTGSVTFLEGNNVLGTGVVSGGSATLVIPQGKKGSRQISASYPGDANNLASTSPRVRLTTK